MWQDKNDAEHFFRQIDANNWEEWKYGTTLRTFKSIWSPSSKTINLVDFNDKFIYPYIQLKCDKSTMGETLSTITHKLYRYGYWTDKNLCR